MPTSGDDRSKKYSKKYDPSVIEKRFASISESSKKKEIAIQQSMATIMSAVRSILNESGVFPIHTGQYQAFASKLFGVCHKFSSNSAVAQATLEYSKWLSYGSSLTVLNKIWSLFAYVLGLPPNTEIILLYESWGFVETSEHYGCLDVNGIVYHPIFNRYEGDTPVYSIVIMLPLGLYAIQYAKCNGDWGGSWDRWEKEGNIEIGDPYATPTSLTINGNGTLKLFIKPPD